ncbi:MAG: hypothetical protein VX279_02985, partial [Candidatus Neomarinimicrobiota bacterium]|nr:hypothetical protein [Candidatus Neomarinimicrobiota bacterium]
KRSKSICSRISRPVYTWLKKERSGTLTMDEYSYPLSLALGQQKKTKKYRIDLKKIFLIPLSFYFPAW